MVVKLTCQLQILSNTLYLRASQIQRRKLKEVLESRHGEERSAKINEKTYKNVLYFVAKLHKRWERRMIND